MTSKTYSVKEMAQLVGIPASTAAYYRDQHPHFFEKVATGGRHPRYTEESLEALRLIAEMVTTTENHQEIDEALSVHFTRLIEINPTTTVQQQQHNNSNFPAVISPAEALGIVAQSMQIIADYKTEVEALRAEVKELREIVNSNSNTAATQEPPSQQNSQESQTQPATQPRRWWQIWKG